jgi:hypothetical protein
LECNAAPEDTGNAVAFLAGTIVHVDGGYVAVRSTVNFKNMRGD